MHSKKFSEFLRLLLCLGAKNVYVESISNHIMGTYRKTLCSTEFCLTGNFSGTHLFCYAEDTCNSIMGHKQHDIAWYQV